MRSGASTYHIPVSNRRQVVISTWTELKNHKVSMASNGKLFILTSFKGRKAI